MYVELGACVIKRAEPIINGVTFAEEFPSRCFSDSFFSFSFRSCNQNRMNGMHAQLFEGLNVESNLTLSRP